MFNNLKLKIKNKLRNWLEINILEDKLIQSSKELQQYKDEVMIRSEQYRNNIKKELNNINEDLIHNTEGINILHNTIENVVHIGADVRGHHYRDEHSWAVVCIEGKINIVKFIDLDRKDAREVLDFLKHFEAGRHCIDTPMNPMFYDTLFKF